MGRSLASTVVLIPLVLLGACLEMAPRSSVPFQATAERQTRYAAEIALSVKEDRRGETSEAAANGRMVLPQLPEIWAPPVAGRNLRQAPRGLDLARLEPGAGSSPAERACASVPAELPGEAPLTDCGSLWRGNAAILPPFDDRSIPPMVAPSTRDPNEEASRPEPRPSG